MAKDLRSEYGISDFADFVRWHYDDLTTVYADAGRNTISMLGFDAVVLTLGSNQLTQISGVAKGFVIGGTICLIIALFTGLLAMRPRQIQSVNSTDLVHELKQLASGKANFRYPDQTLEHILHAHTESTNGSPLVELLTSNRKRGNWLLATMCLSAFGAAFYGVSLLSRVWR